MSAPKPPPDQGTTPPCPHENITVTQVWTMGAVMESEVVCDDCDTILSDSPQP
jgi:hypothetical protein